MERWAANTLRTIGIILTTAVVLLSSFLLLLLSMCAFRPGFDGTASPGQGYAFVAVGVVVLGTGIFIIARLARGIVRSLKQNPAQPSLEAPHEEAAPEPELGSAAPSLPLRPSPPGQRALDILVIALVAQVLIGAGIGIFNQLHFWSPRPYPRPPLIWILIPALFVLWQIPNCILIYVLSRRPSRAAFAFSLAIPAVLILQALLNLAGTSQYYAHNPSAIVFFLIPLGMDVLVLVLAFRATERVGLEPPPSSVMAAALASVVFFYLLQAASTFFYRHALM